MARFYFVNQKYLNYYIVLFNKKMMDIKTLRIIECVARLQSFSRAADEICLSNAAISAAVNKAEQHFRLALFERTTRHVRLTPLGQSFIGRIRLLVKDYDNLLGDMTQTVRHRTGRVAIGCLSSIAVRVMPKAVAYCAETYPGVAIEIRDAAAKAVYEEVSAGLTDFAIVGEFQPSPDLQFLPLILDPLVLICPAGFPLAQRKRLSIDELIPYSFILLSQETGVRSVLEKALGPMEETFTIRQEVTQLSSLIGMVEEGLGISFVPSLALPRIIPPTLAVVKGIHPAIERHIGMLRRADRPLSPAALASLACVRQALGLPATLPNHDAGGAT